MVSFKQCVYVRDVYTGALRKESNYHLMLFFLWANGVKLTIVKGSAASARCVIKRCCCVGLRLAVKSYRIQ